MPHITLLNESFKVSPDEAGVIWSYSVPLPASQSPEDRRPSPERVRMSPDERWVIRRHVQFGEERELSPQVFAETATREFLRLQGFGIKVLSRAITPSDGGKFIFTISPFVKGIVPCTTEDFDATILNRLGPYRAQSVRGFMLSDIEKREQYSKFGEHAPDQTAFLRDVDPYMDGFQAT